MAIEKKATGWIVMPCCIRKEQYLGSSCQVLIDDDQSRFSLLVGALGTSTTILNIIFKSHYFYNLIASTYNAQEIRNIDKRITNRNIIVAGGVYDKTKDNENVHDKIENDDNIYAFKRKRLPKLILS